MDHYKDKGYFTRADGTKSNEPEKKSGKGKKEETKKDKKDNKPPHSTLVWKWIFIFDFWIL